MLSLHNAPLDLLVHRCAEETARFFRGEVSDARYGLELFRRAIVERDDAAWEAIYTQYHCLVRGWLTRHPQFCLAGETPEDLVNDAFARLWAALDAEKFARFTDLAALLRYLQMCAHSGIIDRARRACCDMEYLEAAPSVQERMEVEVETPGQWAVSAEEEVLERLSAADLWRQVRAMLHDDLEELVVYATFVLGESPREIYRHHADRFASVQAVYNIKRNVMLRLERHFHSVQF